MRSAPHLYRAFGLTISSEIPLDELPPAEGGADVTVSIGGLDEVAHEEGRWTVIVRPGDVVGWAPAAGGFRVLGGREIIVAPAPRADLRALRMAIVGPLLGAILGQRGAFVLHASTVRIAGCAVALSGPSGRGKSTLTAALNRAGHPLIADDMTVIETRDSTPWVEPGFPRLKLWPDAATAMEQDVSSLPRLHPDRDKLSVRPGSAFHPGPVRLVRCYLLEDGDHESVTALETTVAVMSLVRNTYQAQWMPELGGAGPNLRHCAALADTAVVRRLTRRRDFAVLPEVVAFIERDVLAAV